MRYPWLLRLFAALTTTAAVLTVGSTARAQPAPAQPGTAQPAPTVGDSSTETDTSYSSQWRLYLSGGYARLGANGDTILDNIDGWYIDAQFARRLNPSAPWWIGLSLSTSYYRNDETVSTGTGVSSEQEIQADISTIGIEPTLTWDLLGRRDHGLYFGAKIGAGLLIANYYSTHFTSGGAFIASRDETQAAFDVRPGLQLGYSSGMWSFGGEASYMFAWGDFGQVGNMIDELRLGVFFRANF